MWIRKWIDRKHWNYEKDGIIKSNQSLTAWGHQQLPLIIGEYITIVTISVLTFQWKYEKSW